MATTARPNNDVVLRPASPSDEDAAARILAQAFATDELTVGLLPPGNRDDRLHDVFLASIRETFGAGGHVWLAGDGAGELLGVALWDAPGRAPRHRDRILAVPRYLRAFGARITGAIRAEAISERHRPLVPHWYLRAIGTVPQARGTGIAGALLRDRLSAADATGSAAYLESSSNANARYYGRFGFVPISRIQTPGSTAAIGMWRPASIS